MSSITHITGVFKGTGAAVEVKGDKVGFQPKSVRLHNVTDGSFAFWTEDMGAGAMQKQKANATTTVAAGGAGITALATGFSLGADADLNASGDTIYFECLG